MLRLIGVLILIASISTAFAAAGMDPKPAGAQGATSDASTVTPAEPPAKPATVPPPAAAIIIPGAILIGVGAALAGGGGNEADFSQVGTTSTGTL